LKLGNNIIGQVRNADSSRSKKKGLKKNSHRSKGKLEDRGGRQKKIVSYLGKGARKAGFPKKKENR